VYLEEKAQSVVLDNPDCLILRRLFIMTTTTIKAERPKRKRWLIIIVAVVLLLVGFLVVSTIGRIRDNRIALQEQTGDTVAAFIGDLAASATASGQVKASQSAGLSANAPGLVTGVTVRVGDEVRAGELANYYSTVYTLVQTSGSQFTH
jgi:multidrug efflux pump subunit AcrA (membrane-fusion protein)